MKKIILASLFCIYPTFSHSLGVCKNIQNNKNKSIIQQSKLDKQLYKAIIENNGRLIYKAFSKGANINSRHENNNTVLHGALSSEINKKIVFYLIKRIENINAVNNLNETFLHLIAQSTIYTDKEQLEIAKKILDRGAQISLSIYDKPSWGHTPIYEALHRQKYTLARKFLSYNSPIDNIRNSKVTALYVLLWSLRTCSKSVEEDDISMVNFLIDKKASVNRTCGNNNRTPLFEAIKFNSMPLVSALIKGGAQIDEQSYNLALNNNLFELETLLSKMNLTEKSLPKL